MTTTTQITEQDILSMINDMEELQNYDDTFLDDCETTGAEIITDCLKDSHYKTLRKMIDFINHKKNNMMNKLIKNHDIIVNELKEEQKLLKEITSEYREANHFSDFIDDKIKYDPNRSEGLSVHKIYDVYKQWYYAHDLAYPKRTLITFKSRKELSIYLDKRYGEYYSPGVTSKDKGYKGLIIVCPMNLDEDCKLDKFGHCIHCCQCKSCMKKFEEDY